MPPEPAPGVTVLQQRFCPLCDRPIVDGEAVLRCDGCGVLHHPSCWVKNDGCVTESEHLSNPIAQAYTPMRMTGGEAPYPGEGVRRPAAAIRDKTLWSAPDPVWRAGRGQETVSGRVA